MAFLRFVLTQRHPDSAVSDGLFRVAYAMRDDPAVDAEERRVLRETLEWFETNLPTPKRFNRSRSKGYYRRATRGVAWFRDTATEPIAHMRRIKDVLEAQGHRVKMLRQTRVGYIVYEDEFQVIAEPFSETRTG